MSPVDKPKYRVAVLNTHPIQYFAPLYRYLNADDALSVTVWYCSRQGVETYADQGFRGVELQWDIDLLSGYQHEFLVNHSPWPAVGRFFGLVNLGVCRKLIAERPDALWIHGHNFATAIVALVVARTLRIPVFYRADTHLGLQRSAVKRQLRPLALRMLFQFVTRALVIGGRNRAFYRANGVPDDKLAAVPYVVDNARFASGARSKAVLAQEGLSAEIPLVLCVNKLQPAKRNADLVEAIRGLTAEGVAVQCVIIGDGDDAEPLRALSADLPNVHFAGFRNQRELPLWYAAATVCVLPATNEAWGLTVNESLAAGTPVIVSDDVGCVPDLVIDGVTGYRFAAGDVRALTDRLRTVCSDASVAAALGQGAAKHMETWSFTQARQGLLDALHSLRR